MQNLIVEYSHNMKYLLCPVCKNNFSTQIPDDFLADLHRQIHTRADLDTPESYADMVAKYQQTELPFMELYTILSTENA